MNAANQQKINRREIGGNVWLSHPNFDGAQNFSSPARKINYEVLESESAVGRALFDELKTTVEAKNGDVTFVLLGGRGAQALYRIIGELAPTGKIDALLGKLHVFTQDALAPMRMNNSLSFVRDFERLLGADFFRKVKSFTPMQTDTENLEKGLEKYLEKLHSFGGIDLFFLGLGPEAEAASHLAYIKPHSGARAEDVAGIIPISESILNHHINKFKIGGSAVSETDEAECRSANSILTLGPAAILSAKRIVQSIVDADTAPAKKACYKKFLETEISADMNERARQMDENPGLWLRLHPNVRSLILPNVLED